MRAATRVWLSPALERLAASSRASARRRSASATRSGKRTFFRVRWAIISSRKSLGMHKRMMRERYGVKAIASPLWPARASPPTPVGEAGLGQDDLVGRSLGPLLSETRERQQDERRLSSKENSKGLSLGLGAHFVDFSSEVAGRAQTILSDILHRGDDGRRLFVRQSVHEGLYGARPSGRPVVSPAQAAGSDHPRLIGCPRTSFR